MHRDLSKLLDELDVQAFDLNAGRQLRPNGKVVGQAELPIDSTGYNDPNCNPNYTQTSSCQRPEGQEGCTSSGCYSTFAGATCGQGCGTDETMLGFHCTILVSPPKLVQRDSLYAVLKLLAVVATMARKWAGGTLPKLLWGRSLLYSDRYCSMVCWASVRSIK